MIRPSIDSTGSDGMKRGTKNTTVMPIQIHQHIGDDPRDHKFGELHVAACRPHPPAPSPTSQEGGV